jgi:hypothetical protein
MSAAMIRWQSRLWWLLPVLVLGIVLASEVDWGRQVHKLPESPPPVEARPVTPALLPEYTVAGGLAGHAETVNRTLFNPTRRPAPAALADGGRSSQMKTGQFILTGTSLSGDRSIAFLKEVAGGKFRSVRKGEQINGMLVAEVKPDRVRLTLGGDSEELVLKVAPGPKATATPAPATAAAPGAAGGANPGVGEPPVRAEGARLNEMRRRAAEAATAAEVMPPAANVPNRNNGAAVPQPTTAAPGATTPAAGQGTPASSDANWNEVYERMRQRSAPPK